MARLPAVIEVIARHDSRGAKTIENYARVIREAGLLPRGKRGVGAPHMTAEDAANLLMGLCGTSEAAKAPEAVKLLRSASVCETGISNGSAVEPSSDLLGKWSIADSAQTLGDILAALIDGEPYDIEHGIGATNLSVKILEVTDGTAYASVTLDNSDLLAEVNYHSHADDRQAGQFAVRGIKRATTIDLFLFADLSRCIRGEDGNDHDDEPFVADDSPG